MPRQPFHLEPSSDLIPPSARLYATLPTPTFDGYPAIRSPLIPGTCRVDELWLDAAKKHPVFTASIHPNDRAMRNFAMASKSVHLQQIFWGRLDKVNRRNRNSQGRLLDPVIWTGDEMEGMLNWFRLFFHCPHTSVSQGPRTNMGSDGLWRIVLDNSPWFDCPLYDRLKRHIMIRRDGRGRTNQLGQYVQEDRDPREPGMESEFIMLWRVHGFKQPVRRFRNGDLVCRADFDKWRAEVGNEAAEQWWEEAYGLV